MEHTGSLFCFSVMTLNKAYVQILVAMNDLFPNERDHMIVFVSLYVFACLFVWQSLGSPSFSEQNVKHKMYKIKKDHT